MNININILLLYTYKLFTLQLNLFEIQNPPPQKNLILVFYEKMKKISVKNTI